MISGISVCQFSFGISNATSIVRLAFIQRPDVERPDPRLDIHALQFNSLLTVQKPNFPYADRREPELIFRIRQFP